jgi:hypothetical protein
MKMKKLTIDLIRLFCFCVLPFIVLPVSAQLIQIESERPCTIHPDFSTPVNPSWFWPAIVPQFPLTRDTREFAMPGNIGFLANQDQYGRYAVVNLRWEDDIQISWFAKHPNHGVEFELVQYNYNDAASKGWGPAYASQEQTGWWTCDLPGCYKDSPLFSSDSEVQIAFGTASFGGSSLQIDPLKVYHYAVRLVTGFKGKFGNKNLVKFRGTHIINAAPEQGPTGLSVFQCSGLQGAEYIGYNQRVFIPSKVEAWWKSTRGVRDPKVSPVFPVAPSGGGSSGPSGGGGSTPISVLEQQNQSMY